ncbi:MAG: RNA methyltransferase [Acidimicrobiia bacterium]|nr:RNA methyltransferase [Acidimicrobiia bacterium]
MEPVRSPRNTRVARAVRLHRAGERAQSGLTLLEGPHLLAEAVQAGVEPIEVFGLESDEDSRSLVPADRWISVTQEVLDRLAPTESPRGPIAVVPIPDDGSVTRDSVTIGTTDPGNAGTLIRSAAAFGLDVVKSEVSVDLWSPKVLRAGAGAHYRTTIGRLQHRAGLIATVVEGGMPAEAMDLERDRPWSILVGSEAHGLTAAAIRSADRLVTIPMVGGTESLNAGVAGSILAYELRRWRNAAGAWRASR